VNQLAKRLTAEEALALIARRRREWCLLGVGISTGAKTYMCAACYRQHVTLQTPGATLPARCPRCGAEQCAPH